MADDRPHAQNLFLNDRTRTALWVEWQRRRRHPDYSPAVDSCLQELSTHLSTLSFSTPLEDQERAHTVQFLQTLTTLLQQHATSAQRDRTTESRIWALLRPLCDRELRTLFPPLAKFAYEWGLRLPLAPTIPHLPDWVAAMVFPRNYEIILTYKRVYEDLNLWPQHEPELVVEFRIRAGASHDELREQFDAILARHAHWNHPRTHRIRPKQTYYENLFRVYDLHSHGHTLSAIAQQLWPHEWHGMSQGYGSKQTLRQRVRGHLKRARELICEE